MNRAVGVQGLIYKLATVLAQPLLLIKLFLRGAREPGYRTHIGERFGLYRDGAQARAGAGAGAGAGPCVWVHAVSLGETRAAAALIDELRRTVPGLRLLLTHGTATGRAEGARLLREGDRQCWLPWDSPGAVRRFVAHHTPDVGVLMETEVWPHLVEACTRAGVPLVLANARLSDQSLRKALRWRKLACAAFGGLHAVCAQTDADAERLRSLGAPVIGVFGNLKFDATPDADLWSRGRRWRATLRAPVWMFASSREGEEAALLAVLQEYQLLAGMKSSEDATNIEAFEAPQLLIVPRHPQRFDEVAGLIEAAGWACVRRSQWGADGPATPAPQRPTIWLGDSLGEMALYYGLADVALLGGSFAPLGGQNLIEAAACGCPVIMGPHTFNFADAALRAEQAGAALRVPDLATALETAQALCTDRAGARRAAAQGAALAFAAAHRGSAARQAEVVRAVVDAGVSRGAPTAPAAAAEPHSSRKPPL